MKKMNGKDNSTGILVISDLHVTDEIYGRGQHKSKLKEDESFKTRFEQCVVNEAKDNGIDFKYLLVLGDVSDFALESEFVFAKDFLNSVCRRVGIDLKNVLIVPGNHDMDRELFRRYCYKKKIPPKRFLQLSGT